MSGTIQMKMIIYTILFFSFVTTIYSETPDKLQIYSPNYFNEQTNIYEKINYLENEPLSFKFCTNPNSQNISFNLICSVDNDKIELKPYEYIDKNKGCYFNNYDLSTFNCDQFKLEIGYTLNNKQKKVNREFKKQKESLLINHILEKDYKTLSPVDLSYYLIVLNDVQDSNKQENLEIYEKLKNERNNINKCWPKTICSFKDTTTILKNLVLSNYPLNIRMLDDGKSYLEKYIINNENNPLRFLITPRYSFNESEEIECSLTVDKDSDETRNYIFDQSSYDNDEMIIEKESSSKIEFNCNATLDEIELKLYNIDDTLLKTQIYNNTKSINYDIEIFSCVGDAKCDYYNSIDSLITYGSTIEDAPLIGKYLDSLVEENYNERYVQFLNKILDTSKYLYYKTDVDLVNYLKFHQNNDGSWGSAAPNIKILETSWAILGLEKSTSNSEYIEDGKKWVYYNEPVTGWGDIEKNVISYLAIKEKLKPYVKINIKNQITKTTTFELENPTIYDLKNLKINFNDEIKQYLSYLENIGDLNGQDTIEFKITLDENFFGLKSGEMSITGLDGKNKEVTLIKIPINIIGDGIISIKNYEYSVSENNRKVKVEIESKLEKFEINCDFLNPFTNAQQTIKLNEQNKFFEIPNENLTQGNFSISIQCENNNIDFIIPFAFSVVKTNPTIESETKQYILNTFSDFAIPIKNSLIADKQTIQITVDGMYSGVVEPTEKSKILARNETREIYFSITSQDYVEALGEGVQSNIIITGENGYVLKIPIIYENSTGINGENGTSSNMIWYIMIAIIVLAGLGILVLIRYRQLQEEHQEEHHDEDDEFFLDEDLEFE